MIFKAWVKDRNSKEWFFIESEYDKKSDFEADLRSNGYSIRYCETKELVDFVLDNTNGAEWDWQVCRYMQKHKIKFTKNNFDKTKEYINDNNLF